MDYLNGLHKYLDVHNLLNHKFYIAWSNGELSIDTLRMYAREYYPHVAAFPRCISSIHSRCENIEDRKILLKNLWEEECEDEDHPKLWLDFAEGIGCIRKECTNEPSLISAKRLVNEYLEISRFSYPTGLGMLYAYERQTPSVSQSKIYGLKKFYGIEDEKTLKFFNVHQGVDEWHTEQCAMLLNKLSLEDKASATQGAIRGAKLLWNFLDEMYEIHLSTMVTA